MIKISNLTKSYKNKKALNNLSLEIKEGSIFGLLGVNGAGKTTLLSILNGLFEADSGNIEMFGFNMKSDKKAIKAISSIIPQNLAFYENLTVKENLDFFTKIQKATKTDYQKAIEINSLSNLLKQKSSTLSGGQKRRLNIAIGLLNNPKIIYFDEPTVGVDPKTRNEILDSIKNYKNLGITVVYTSHYMTEIERICDDVAIISNGQVIEQNSLENLLTNRVSNKVTIDIIAKNAQNSIDSINEDTLTDLNIKFINTSTLRTLEENLFKTIELLNNKQIYIKQIRYGSTNLESHFLDITSGNNA